MTLKAVVSKLGVIRFIFEAIGCILLGVVAGKIARYFGAPMEIRLLTFAIVTGLSLLVWYYVRTSEGK